MIGCQHCICNRNVSRITNSQLSIDVGAYTIERMEHCCTNYYQNMDWRHLDGVNDHFPLHVPSNWAVFERMRSTCDNCVTLATVREPLEQFLSYYNMYMRWLDCVVKMIV